MISDFICWSRKSGMFWFRLFGRGLMFKSYRTYPPTFSEREGFEKPVQFGGWRVKWLPKYRISSRTAQEWARFFAPTRKS